MSEATTPAFNLADGTLSLSIPLRDTIDRLSPADRLSLMRSIAVHDDFLKWFMKLVVEGEDHMDDEGKVNWVWPGAEERAAIRERLIDSVREILPSYVQDLAYLLSRERAHRVRAEKHAETIARSPGTHRQEWDDVSQRWRYVSVEHDDKPPVEYPAFNYSTETEAFAAYLSLSQEQKDEINARLEAMTGRKIAEGALAPPRAEDRESGEGGGA